MTKKLVWRLKEQPTSESLQRLVSNGILTKDEAREILFSSETEEDRDKESLKSEIKFLRELVEKLANREKVITTIREVEVPIYRQYPWWSPYDIWCGNTYTYADTNATSGNLILSGASTGSGSIKFSDIKTF